MLFSLLKRFSPGSSHRSNWLPSWTFYISIAHLAAPSPPSVFYLSTLSTAICHVGYLQSSHLCFVFANCTWHFSDIMPTVMSFREMAPVLVLGWILIGQIKYGNSLLLIRDALKRKVWPYSDQGGVRRGNWERFFPFKDTQGIDRSPFSPWDTVVPKNEIAVFLLFFLPFPSPPSLPLFSFSFLSSFFLSPFC